MPRNPRSSLGGVCYHIINRGNAQQTVFHDDADYQLFLKSIAHACIEVAMPIYAYCLMPNHFHLVVQPVADGDLSTWMHWLQNTHIRRHHRIHQSSGHLWQGRFKSFPIQEDDHLQTVLRYVERNPVRAKLARTAQRWAWSSARAWATPTERPTWLVDAPITRPANWLDIVNEPLTTAELESLRRSVNRGTPYGSKPWIESTAKNHGIESTLRTRGRPRKPPRSTSEDEMPE